MARYLIHSAGCGPTHRASRDAADNKQVCAYYTLCQRFAVSAAFNERAGICAWAQSDARIDAGWRGKSVLRPARATQRATRVRFCRMRRRWRSQRDMLPCGATGVTLGLADIVGAKVAIAL